jgi:uncharacterized protein
MKTFIRAARWVLLGSSAVALIVGVLIWTGAVPAVALGLHETTGYLALLALWSLAGVAARSRERRGLAFTTAALGFVALAVSLAQWPLMTWKGLWAIQVLHVAAWVVAVVWAMRLVKAMARDEAGEGATPGLATKQAAAEFLAKRRIAVTGVSRKAETHGSNSVYRRLRERGYQVFAVNPNAKVVEGDRAFPDLKSITGGVEAVVIATGPEHAMETMEECADLGITQVWMHRAVDRGSVSDAATAWGRAHGIRVIDGGCPLMFGPCADAGHKLMRPVLTLFGRVPRRVS